MNARDIEIAVAEHFGIFQHLIVPNVSYGLIPLHECDLLIVTLSGYATEIEIKVSRSDLKNDAKKHHGHRNDLIRRLFFAIPPDLQDLADCIPERAGIVVVNVPDFQTKPSWMKSFEWAARYQSKCAIVRPAKINRAAVRLSDEQMLHLGRLASMRIWSLKRKLADERSKQLPEQRT